MTKNELLSQLENVSNNYLLGLGAIIYMIVVFITNTLKMRF